MTKTGSVVSPEFKGPGHKVIIIKPYLEEDGRGPGRGLPNPDSLIRVWKKAKEMLDSGDAVSAYTPGIGGIAEAVMKMGFGNGIGFKYDLSEGGNERVDSFRSEMLERIFCSCYGSIVLELSGDLEVRTRGVDVSTVGYTTAEQTICFADESVSMDELLKLYEERLGTATTPACDTTENINYKARSWHAPIYKRAEPKVLIPVFPGTVGEYESASCVREAGAVPEVMIIRNRTASDIEYAAESFASALKETQMLLIPGGFAGGDGPDYSAKTIAAFLENEAVKEEITELLEKKDGLILGLGNGFQALVRLGLLPYGRFAAADEERPVLTYNSTGLHRSSMVRIRISSDKSPWLRGCETGAVYCVPVSYGEGRFIATDEELASLATAGQIATQYADFDGNATDDVNFNPAGSMRAVEGICSPDGRVLGRMGHPERVGSGLYKNVPGSFFTGMFENAVRYFK